MRIAGDGSETLYRYNAAQQKYTSTDGAGAHDSLTYKASTSTWTWEEGSSLVREEYRSVNGALLMVGQRDREGREIRFAHNGTGLVNRITDASGQVMHIDYAGNRVTGVRLISGGKTTQHVHYGYDSQNRLESVSVDLTPDDRKIADGQIFKTTYKYHGNSERVSEVRQSDGSVQSFGYALIGGKYRVNQVVRGEGSEAVRTLYQHNTTDRTTTIIQVVDTATGTGPTTTLKYDSQGRLISQTSPADQQGQRLVTSYEYEDDHLVLIRHPGERQTRYEYDSHGNQTRVTDPTGGEVVRVYNDANQLVRETVAVDHGGDATARVSHWVYDGLNRERFAIDAEGTVTETRYINTGSQGRIVSTLVYLEKTTRRSEYTLAHLESFAAANKTRLQRIDTLLDFRGQVASVTRFSKVDANSRGVRDGSESTTYSVLDARGRLLATVDPRGNGAASTVFRTSHTYDGLGRRLSSTDARGETTTTVYQDAQSQIIGQSPEGLQTVRLFDSAGRLVSQTANSVRSNTQQLGKTEHFYDELGRLRATRDASGAISHQFYDKLSRVTARVDATGAVTLIQYNENGQISRETVLAGRITSVQLSSLLQTDSQGNVTGIKTAVPLSSVQPEPDAGKDRSVQRFYDESGRTRFVVDGEGFVTENRYNRAGDHTYTVRHSKNSSSLSELSYQRLKAVYGSSNVGLSLSSSQSTQTTAPRQDFTTSGTTGFGDRTNNTVNSNAAASQVNSTRGESNSHHSAAVKDKNVRQGTDGATVSSQTEAKNRPPQQPYNPITGAIERANQSKTEAGTVTVRDLPVTRDPVNASVPTMNGYYVSGNTGTKNATLNFIQETGSVIKSPLSTKLVAGTLPALTPAKPANKFVITATISPLGHSVPDTFQQTFITTISSEDYDGSLNLRPGGTQIKPSNPLPDGAYKVDVKIVEKNRTVSLGGITTTDIPRVTTSLDFVVGAAMVQWPVSVQPVGSSLKFSYRLAGSGSYVDVPVLREGSHHYAVIKGLENGHYDYIINYQKAGRDIQSGGGTFTNGSGRSLSFNKVFQYDFQGVEQHSDAAGSYDDVSRITAIVKDSFGKVVSQGVTDPRAIIKEKGAWDKRINLTSGNQLADGAYTVSVEVITLSGTSYKSSSVYEKGVQHLPKPEISWPKSFQLPGSNAIFRYRIAGGLWKEALVKIVGSNHVATLPVLNAGDYEYQIQYRSKTLVKAAKGTFSARVGAPVNIQASFETRFVQSPLLTIEAGGEVREPSQPYPLDKTVHLPASTFTLGDIDGSVNSFGFSGSDFVHQSLTKTVLYMPDLPGGLHSEVTTTLTPLGHTLPSSFQRTFKSRALSKQLTLSRAAASGESKQSLEPLPPGRYKVDINIVTHSAVQNKDNTWRPVATPSFAKSVTIDVGGVPTNVIKFNNKLQPEGSVVKLYYYDVNSTNPFGQPIPEALRTFHEIPVKSIGSDLHVRGFHFSRDYKFKVQVIKNGSVFGTVIGDLDVVKNGISALNVTQVHDFRIVDEKIGSSVVMGEELENLSTIHKVQSVVRDLADQTIYRATTDVKLIRREKGSWDGRVNLNENAQLPNGRYKATLTFTRADGTTFTRDFNYEVGPQTDYPAVVKWPASFQPAGSAVSFQYRQAGSDWKDVGVITTGGNHQAELGEIANGTYEYRIEYLDGNQVVKSATGELTVKKGQVLTGETHLLSDPLPYTFASQSGTRLEGYLSNSEAAGLKDVVVKVYDRPTGGSLVSTATTHPAEYLNWLSRHGNVGQYDGSINLTDGKTLGNGRYRVEVTRTPLEGAASKVTFVHEVGTQTEYEPTVFRWEANTQPAGTQPRFEIKKGNTWETVGASRDGSHFKVTLGRLAEGSYDYRIRYMKGSEAVKSASGRLTADNGKTINGSTTFTFDIVELKSVTGTAIKGVSFSHSGLNKVVATVRKGNSVVATTTTWPKLYSNYQGEVNLKLGSTLGNGSYQVSLALHYDNGQVQTKTLRHEIGQQPVKNQVVRWSDAAFAPRAGEVVSFHYRPKGSTGSFQSAAVSRSGNNLSVNLGYQLSGRYEVQIRTQDDHGRFLREARGELAANSAGNMALSYTVPNYQLSEGTVVQGFISARDAAKVDYLVATVTDRKTGRTVGQPVRTYIDPATLADNSFAGRLNLTSGDALPKGDYSVSVTVHNLNGTTSNRPAFIYQVGPQQNTLTKPQLALHLDEPYPVSQLTLKIRRPGESNYTTLPVNENKLSATLDSLAAGEYEYQLQYTLTIDSAPFVKSGNGRITVAGGETTVMQLNASHKDYALADNRVSRNFYDDAGRLQGSLDAEGYLTELRYNGADQVVESLRYAARAGNPETEAGRLADGSFASLKPALTAQDRKAYTLYDGQGRVSAAIDAEGYVTEYGYDAAGNRIRTRRYADALTALELKIALDAVGGDASKLSLGSNRNAGQVRPLNDAKDRIWERQFSARNELLRESSPEGVVTEYSYNKTGQQLGRKAGVKLTGSLLQTGYALNGSAVREMRYEYDALGRITKETDARGNSTRHYYDQQGNRVATHDAHGQVTSYSYDDQRRLIQSVSPEGQVVEHSYNSFGERTETRSYQANRYGVVEKDGTAGWRIYDNDPEGAEIKQVFDTELGQDVVEVKGSGTSNGFELNAANGSDWVDSSGKRIQWKQSLTGDFRVYALVDTSKGRSYLQLVPGYGEPTLGVSSSDTKYYTVALNDVNDGNWHTVSVDIEAELKKLDPEVSVNHIFDFKVRGSGRFSDVRVIPENADIQTFDYNKRGQVAQRTDAEGYQTRSTYNAFGERTALAQAVDKANQQFVRTTSTFDRLGRAVSTTAERRDAGNLTTRASFDAFGQVVENTDARGNKATATYDRLGRQTGTTNALGGTESLELRCLWAGAVVH